MRNTGLEEAQAGIKVVGEISITSDMQKTPPLWQKVKKKQDSEKVKLNIQKTKIMASSPVTSLHLLLEGKLWPTGQPRQHIKKQEILLY